jgi:hypothetical protein
MFDEGRKGEWEEVVLINNDDDLQFGDDDNQESIAEWERYRSPRRRQEKSRWTLERTRCIGNWVP